MGDREHPDDVAGPYRPPKRSVTDHDGRDIDIVDYGEGPVDDEFEAVVEMYLRFDPADRAQGIPPCGEERVRQWLTDRIFTERGINVVAWYGRAAVGHATLVPDSDRTYELALFVRSPYRNVGVGRELLEAVLGAGREAGIERVWLSVQRRNDPAIALYDTAGFEPADTDSIELVMVARLH